MDGPEELATPPDAPAPPGRVVLAAVALAFVLRAVFVFAWDSPGRAAEAGGTWDWGHEPLCIASALVRGDGYADPWCHGTGETAWLTPLYPGLLAGLLLLLDGVRLQSSVLFLLQAAASAWTCLILWRFAARAGTPRAGVLAAWLWALHPQALWHATTQVWDTTFVALGLALLLERLLAAGPRPRPAAARRLGLGHGLLLMLNPASISLAPLVVFLLARGQDGWGRRVRIAAEYACFVGLVVLPWSLRNYVVIGTPGLRSNLGVELRVGNHEGADGRPGMGLHPSDDAAELERFRALGERGYAAWARAQAADWIRAHPGRFASLTLGRAGLFWFGTPPWKDTRTHAGAAAVDDFKTWIKYGAHAGVGLAGLAGLALLLRRRRPGHVLVGAALLFPGPYYLTHVSERYRMQLEPVLVLAASWLVVELWQRRRSPAGGRLRSPAAPRP